MTQVSEQPEYARKRERTMIVSVVIVIIASTFIAAALSGKYFAKESITALEPLDSVYQSNRRIINEHSHFSDTAKSLLLAKAAVIELKKNHHKQVFSKIFMNHYATVTLFPFLSGILVIVSFLVAQKGWANSPNVLKAVFLTYALLASLYGLFPVIYKQGETINQNMQAYINYNKLQKQIVDFSLTSPQLYGKTLTLDEFLDYVNKQEHDLDNISFWPGVEIAGRFNSGGRRAVI